MLTITTLKDSAFRSLGQWLSSVVQDAKSLDDQDMMGTSVSLFLIEVGQARYLVGARDTISHVIFVYPEGPLVGYRGEEALAVSANAKNALRDETKAIDCVISNFNNVDWNKDDGYHSRMGARTVSIHFNFGYRSLTFVKSLREQDLEGDPVWMICTDTPRDSEFDGWARMLTPIETVHER
jgi:hypothetical protein